MNLRLAIVRQRFNPFGGAERFIARALPALERAGGDVTLICRKAEGWDARKVMRVDPFYIGKVWRDWSFARAARTAWRRAGFDIVQSHERIPGCDVYRAGDGVHRRWLELRATAASFVERLGIALNPYHRYVCAAERRLFEHPRLRAVICNSRMVSDEIRRGFRISPEKLHVVYNGVDLAHFHPGKRDELRGAARAELGCQPRDTLFLFVGAGFSRKGLDATIEALKLAAHGWFWLLVVGTDRESRRYAAQAAPLGHRVRFLGGREDVRPFYAAADCLILPSRYDPFPNTVLEAFAMGLPAIVSSRCGAAEVIEQGMNGWVCEPDDAPGIARLMHEADAAMRSGTLPQAARRTAERYGMDEMAGKLSALYASLAREAA
ncbi:MAG TPA: glycosyltransferase family 4 protein [Burkholderiales bacterium]|nr:glycosyltransferase family 4 protein [Burkholderiales bacterium]